MKPAAQHPSLLSGRHRLCLAWFAATALLQMAWALAVLYASRHRPEALLLHGPAETQAATVYAAYSGIAAFFVGVATFWSWFLDSRGWLRTAAFASAIPGFGILFGLLQIMPGILVYRTLGQREWVDFFAWRERRFSGNRLTS